MNAQPQRLRAGANHLLLLAILMALLLPTRSLWADLSVAYSGSSEQAVIVSFFDRQTVGSSLVGTLQIQNISGTWVYIEQDLTSSANPVAMPYTIYLLGPDAIKTFPSFTFSQDSYLKLVVTTPVGLDFTQASEKRTALQGALAVDLLTRGLLTFSLPPDAFDQPPVGQVIEPLLDNLIATVSPIGELAVAIQDRSATEVSSALLDIAADSTHVVNALTPLMQRYATADQVASSLGFFAELINLPEKAALVTDLSARTFGAPPVTWSRMDVASRTQVPSISSVSPTVLTTMPVPQTQALTVHGSGFTSASSLVFTIGTATYPSRPERLQFIDANTLQYNIAVGSAVGTWSVRLADGTDSATFQVQAAPSGLYTITPLSGPHGSITPSAALARAGGESQTFVATPQDPTFTVDTWYVDGVAVPATGNRFTLADIQAPHTVYVTFRVATVAGQTGSLTVSLQPAGAVTGGAQWQIDGGSYRNNNDIVTGLTPGAHNVSFKSVAGYTTPSNQSATVVSNQTASATGNYTPIAPTTYLLTLNQGGSMGSISPSPVGTWNGSAYAYSSGSIVQLTASANPGYHFVSWSGDASGSGNPVTVTMNGNKSVAASFASGDPNMATVTVTIKPDAAGNAGATWSVTGDSQLRASGTSLSQLVGTGYTVYLPITLNLVPGWLGTNGTTSFYVPIAAGIVTNVLLTCVADTTPGLLTVTLSPPDVVTAGAHWHVNGGAYGNGASASLTPGNYTVTFDTVFGWTAPASQPVTMKPAQSIVVPGNYTPPAGQPAIYGISPPIGPMSGGTLMTISGANFTGPASVAIGGQNASNVTVLSASQITCTTPPSSIYGSTNVVVQTSGGNATNLNGFAYGIARGSKLSLVTAVSGDCYSLDVSSNYAFIGEGRNLVVVNVSSPSSPSRVNSILLPGTVYDIKIWGNYAYIANGEAGLQVVDISTPSSPKICGYSLISSNVGANGITISGGRAFVADVNYGLEIFDLTVPSAPSLISVEAIPNGLAYSVITKTSANGVFAFVSTGNGVQVVDVSDPYSPNLRGFISTGGWQTFNTAVSGNYVYAPTWYQVNNTNYELLIIDVSNPNAPTTVGALTDSVNSALKYYNINTVAAANNVLYNLSNFDGGGFTTLNISGSSLVQAGSLPHVTGNNGKIVISGSYAYIATRDSLKIISVANTYSPSLASTFNDSSQMGYYTGIGVSGNTLCALWGSSLQTFDITTPLTTRILGQSSPQYSGYFCVVGNGKAYAISNACISVVDITTPSSPHQVASIPASTVQFIQGIALSGSRLYATGTTPDNRFVAFDVSNPSYPQLIGTKTFTDSLGVGPVGASGNRAVVGGTCLRVLDISNISSPHNWAFSQICLYHQTHKLSFRPMVIMCIQQAWVKVR